MKRRELLRGGVGAWLAGASASGASGASAGPSGESDAWRDVLVADPHAHPEFIAGSRQLDPTTPTLGTLAAARVALSAFAAVGDRVRLRNSGGSPFGDTRSQLLGPARFVESARLRAVLRRVDVAALRPAPEIAWGLLAIEGGDALEGRIENLDAFFDEGVRMLTLVHDRDNELGFNQRSRADGPLTPFGVRVVERMNERGMLVDVAHAGRETLKSIAEVSKVPVVDSHTSPFLPNEDGRGPRRQRTWQEMEWVARTGGVVCTWPLAVSGAQSERSTLVHWADEVVRMKSRLGIEHCGLGTDGGGSLPVVVRGWDSIASWPALASAMLRAGLSRDDVAAFLGGNFLRVLGRALA